MGIEYQLRKRRTTKDGSVTWYAEFLSDEKGSNGRRVRLAIRSTGTSRQADAKRIAQGMIDDGTVTDSRDLIEDFFTRFWTPGESTYLQEVESRKRRALSPTYCHHNRKWLMDYFYPYCRKHDMVKLGDLKPLNLTEWILWLDANRKDFNISGSTVNKIRQAVSVATKWAYMKDLLINDPMQKVPRVGDEPKHRPAFELAEVKALMAETWPDPRTKTGCMLAASTGMRLGEVRGLRDDALHLAASAPHLFVRTNWVDGEGLKPPKSKDKNRQIPLRSKMAAALEEMLLENPYPPGDRFVFWGESQDVPLTGTAIHTDLKRAMKAVGITGKSFHCFRHFANSWMVPAVGDAMTRQFIGHTSSQVQERYTHALEDTMDRIRTAAPELL